MIVLVVILASLLFFDLALKPLDLGVLWLRVRVSKLLCDRSTKLAADVMLASNMLASFSIILAVFRTAKFVVWLAWLLVALICWWICFIVGSHAYVFKVYVIIHIIKLSLSLSSRLVKLGKHVKLFMNVLRRVSLSMSKHLILIFTSLLLHLHLHTRSCLSTLALRCWRVWCGIAIAFLCGKVVVIIAVSHPANLVLLREASLKLLDWSSFVLLANVVIVLVSGASTQPAKLILIRWIPSVFFIFIFYDYFSEEVVRWVLASLLLSQCVRVLLRSIKITLFIGSNLLLFFLIVTRIIRLFLSPALTFLITDEHLACCIICVLPLMNVNGMQQTSSTIAFLQ